MPVHPTPAPAPQASAGQITATSTPAPQRPSARRTTSGGGVGVVPVHPMSEPGERPQHQGRADRGPPGHQITRPAPGMPERWRCARESSPSTSTSAGPPVQQVTAWRARGGGVGGHPTPAPGVPPAVEVCQWCMGLATRSPPAPGRSLPPGQRLTCPSGEGVPDRG